MRLPRRQLLQLGLLSPLALHAAAERTPLADLLQERLKHEGVGLAAARLGPDGALELAAASKAGAHVLSADRHGFEIGSITKVFTGLLLADAVVRGRLKLDDAVEAQLGFPLRDRDGQPLRYVDLATHRSGLPRLAPNLQPATEADPYADYDDAALLASLRAFKPTRRRDEAFEYSNYGMGLLAWLLARQARLSVQALLQQRVFTPLGLGDVAGPARVQGHNAQGAAVPAWHFSEATAGAGALVMSAAQLARFGQAALGQFEHPLGQAFALALHVHSPLGPQPGLRMGLGWMLAEGSGRRVATHDGATFGFTSSLWLNLTAQRGGLVLSNAAVNMADLAVHLMDGQSPLRDPAVEQRVSAQTPLSLGAEQLAPLRGVYAASPQFKLVVRVRDGKLFAQATGQGEFELFASGPRSFFAKVAPLQVVFAGAHGKPEQLVIEQGGRKTPFVREGEEAADPTPEPDALLPLAGLYALNAQFKLMVRAQGARLFAQATGQGEFELFAQADGSFLARVSPLRIRFDAGRPAPALTLEQAGREVRFLRE